MAQVKPVYPIAGGFRQVAATDQVAMDGALVTVTETGGSTAKTLPDHLAGKFNKTGGTVTGSIGATGSLTAGDSTIASPIALYANEAAVSGNASRFAGFNIGGGWQMGQDAARTGVRDFFLYSLLNGFTAFTVSVTTGVFDFKFIPTVNGNQLWGGADPVTPSKAINFRRKMFNVVDYGMDFNANSGAATNNVTAIKNALIDIKKQAFGATLVLPSGLSVWNSTVEEYALPYGLDVEGSANTSIQFTGLAQGANGLGLGVTGGADGRLRVNGLRIIGRNWTNNAAGTLLALYGSGEQGGVAISDLWINCDGTCLPVNHLLIKNPAASGNIRGINILGGGGPFGATGGTTGIAVFSDRLAPDVCFHDVTMQAVGTGFKSTMGQNSNQYTLEGIAFKDCILVGVQTGLNAVSGWYAAPGYSWDGGHINAQQYCVRMDNVSYFAMRNANAQLDYHNNPQAIVFGTSCLAFQIDGNRFQIVDQTGAGGTKPDISGVVAGSGSQMWNVTNNIFGGFTVNSACVVGQSGTTGIYASGNKKFASGSTASAMLSGTVIDDGKNAVLS